MPSPKPNVPLIIQARQRRQEQLSRNPAGRIAFVSVVLASLLAALGILALGSAYAEIAEDLPALETLPALLSPPDGILLQPTRLYDRTGQQVLLTLENPAAERRYTPFKPTAPGQPFLPTSLISATLATADPAFWSHPGFSLESFRRSGQPGLAQRLVNDLLLDGEPAGMRRNLRARLLAYQITAQFGRQQVLEWYLNSANYGRLAYGVDAAGQVYFGKSAQELSLAEAAVLAAVAEAPALNPMDAPQVALERQAQVIQNMLDQGLIDEVQAEKARREKLIFRSADEPAQSLVPAFTNLVLEQLSDQFELARLERGGFRIITTLNSDLQLQATCTAANHLARLNSEQADSQEEKPAADGSACTAARLLPALPASSGLSEVGLAANVVILDPHTGQILAFVSDPSTRLDPAHRPGRPPGSLMTPFIYLTAFTRGFGPASLVWDIPGALFGMDVANFDGQHHGPLRLRVAMANDYLVPAIQILAQIGPENVWQTARQAGFVSLEDSARESAFQLPLDGGDVTLLEASQAFGMLSNQGTLAGRAFEQNPSAARAAPFQALAVQRVEAALGNKVWLDWSTPQTRPVINPQLAYLVTNSLSDETARWPSLGHPNALEIGRPAAAKPGRTLSGKDVWTIGYTPQMVVGVWVGSRNVSPELKLSPNLSAALWHAIIRYAHRELPAEDWKVPPGVSHIDVCDPSGMLPTPNCPAIVNEIFLAGSEPTQPDPLYRAVQINRETGLLATIFTPSDLIQERVYLVVPPEAAEWARQAGLVTPPEEFDVMTPGLPASPDIRITSPAMFAPVRGSLSIQGSAAGEDFAFYRLQVGKGLNPQEWVQIGKDETNPISNGSLGIWDTTGLDGLYVIQLLAVRQDQRVETAVALVTVDNQAPEVQALYPAPGAVFEATQKRTIIFRAAASDNHSLKSVEFFVDNQRVDRLSQPPFSATWQVKAGDHTLRILATDLAGNTRQASLLFTVK